MVIYDANNYSLQQWALQRVQEIKRVRQQGSHPKKHRRKGANKMAWKKLQLPVPIEKQPAMALNQFGRLRWTEAITDLVAVERVEVSFDDETNRLGVCPAAQDNLTAIAMSPGGYARRRRYLVDPGRAARGRR